MVDALAALTQINLDDLVNAFGWQDHPVLAAFVRAVFFRSAQDFARHMVAFDDAIGSCGLAEAACLTEKLYVRDVRLFDSAHIPDGPAIFLANHPGMTDTLALLAALGAPQMRIIALNRPFVRSLPNLGRHLLYVTDDVQERISLVRRVHRHLQSGGSILTFPAGQTEPDPDTQTGALESLETWTDSAGTFLRLAPQVPIVPVCVRGVNWDKAINHPLAQIRRAPLDKHLLASALQLLANVSLHMRPVVARIQFGRPIRASDLGSTEKAAIHRAVLAEMRCLIENPPFGESISAL